MPRRSGGRSVTWTYDPEIQAMVDEVDWNSIQSKISWLVNFGTRHSYTPQCDAVADSLFSFFQRLGLAVEFHSFVYNGRTMRNVVATQPGTTFPDSIFVICAHYDDTSQTPYTLAPGADDNASGTSAVMVAAEILSDRLFKYTIKYICFAGEEQGLKGSQAWCQWASSQGLSIVGAMNFDMVGFWTSGADFDLEMEANNSSVWLVNAAASAADMYSGMPYEIHVYDGAWWGDHASFWDVGYAAINDEEAWDWFDPDFNPYYHTTDDVLAHVDENFAVGSVRTAVAALAALAVPAGASRAESPRPTEKKRLSLNLFPNPTSGAVRFEPMLPGSCDRQIGVYDLAGRLVAVFSIPPDAESFEWNAVGEDGWPLPSGVYFCRVIGQQDSAPAKLVVTK